MEKPRKTQEEMKAFVEAWEAKQKNIQEYEEKEPFIQDLKRISEITKERGREWDTNSYVLESDNYPYVALVRPFDKYARIAEKLNDPNQSQSLSRMDLDYSGEFNIGFRIRMTNFKDLEKFEEPGESIIAPENRKGLEKGNWRDTLSIEGPPDSLGPYTLSAIRKFTKITLAALE